MKKFIVLIIILFASPAFAVDPVVTMRTIPRSTATTALDTAAERLASISGETEISTGAGNELTFLTLDISDGAMNTPVYTVLMHVSDASGNSSISGLKIWVSSIGFNRAGSVVKFQPLSGGDQATPSNTENYIASAEIADYTWATMPESEPASQNIYPSDEGASVSLSTTSDDVLMFAVYIAIADSEVPGIYTGTTSDFELQLSFKMTYN